MNECLCPAIFFYSFFFFFIFPCSSLLFPKPRNRKKGRRKTGCALPLPSPFLESRERPIMEGKAIVLLVRVRFFSFLLSSSSSFLSLYFPVSSFVACCCEETFPARPPCWSLWGVGFDYSFLCLLLCRCRHH